MDKNGKFRTVFLQYSLLKQWLPPHSVCILWTRSKNVEQYAVPGYYYDFTETVHFREDEHNKKLLNDLK